MLLLRFIRGLCVYGESSVRISFCPRWAAGEPRHALSMESPSDSRLPAVLLCFSHIA